MDLDEAKRRILALEEEKENLKKLLEGRADKKEIETRLAEIVKEVSGLRDVVSELRKPLKAPDPAPVKNEEDASAGFYS